jgi:hypothetical protein
VGGLISATIPSGGITTVTGSSGAVEASATVVVSNVTGGAQQSTAASAAGAFGLQLPATIGDGLSVQARDAAGNSSPALSLTAGPPRSAIRVTIQAGDGQVGVQGHQFVDLLQVKVTANGQAVPSLPVQFTRQMGDGTLGADQATTNAQGVAGVSFTLGPSLGAVSVGARVLDGGPNLEVAFQLQSVGSPAIDRIVPDAAVPGEAIMIEGRNFSPRPAHNVVRIGGRIASVTSSTATAIHTTVPGDLPGPTAQVDVTLTGVSSVATSLRILVLPVALPPVGQVTFNTAPGGSGTIQLPFSTGQETYVLAFESTAESSVPFFLNLNTTVPISLSRIPAGVAVSEQNGDPEAEILKWGYELLAGYGPMAPGRRRLALSVDRTFWVFNEPQLRFEARAARLSYEGAGVAIYVDNAVLEAEFPASEIQAMGQRFEQQVYQQIRNVYGTESDLDANGKVIILFTPLVNILATPEGRTLGFFVPGDLAVHPFSNRGEVFYSIVPDPSGRFAIPTGTAIQMRDQIVATAAHEFVHMINANERIVTRGLPPQNIWLEEGLAHFGEFVVGLPFVASSNILAFLLEGTSQVSLFRQADFFNRGASALFVVRLDEVFGRGIIRALVTAPGTGVASIQSATGQSFGGIFHGWVLALYNEMYPIPGVTQTFSTLDLLGFFTANAGPPDLANALGRFGGSVQSGLTGFIIMERGAVAYVGVETEKRLVVADLQFSAPSNTGLQVSAVRIR